MRLRDDGRFGLMTFMLRLLAVFLLAGAALPVSGETLLGIYRLAQENDPVYLAARHAFEAAEEKVPQARAGNLPVLNLGGSDNTIAASSDFGGTPHVDRNVRARTWAIQLTQPLFRLQNDYAYSEAEWLVEQARAQYDKAGQELILRVAQAYFGALVAGESIEVADAQIKAAGEQLVMAQRGFEAGANAITDVHEAKSRSDLARASRIAALNELEARRAELEKIAGRVPGALTALRPAAVIPGPQPDSVQAWVERAREYNPAVLAPKAAVNAADAAVGKNRAEHLPTLDLMASYGHNYSSGNTGTPIDYETRAKTRQYGVQLNIPLYSGGATSSRVTEAIANRNRAADELEAARREAGTDARQAYAAIINGLAQIEALESAVESSKSAVSGNRAGYKLGIHMNIDVLNAEQQLYTAQRDLVKARYDTLFQGLRLKAAAGILAEPDLAPVSGMFAENNDSVSVP